VVKVFPLLTRLQRRAENTLLAEGRFDPFVEDLCRKFYHDSMGRPSLAPGIYFRL
jgi:transposase